MDKGRRSLFVLAIALVTASLALPHWFEQRASGWETSWGVWGAHACHTSYSDDCEFPSFDKEHAGQKHAGWVVIGAGSVLALALCAILAVRQRQPWMKLVVQSASLLGGIAAWEFATSIPPTQGEGAVTLLGPNAILCFGGCVLAFALAATTTFDAMIEPMPEPQLEPADPPGIAT